MGCIYLPPRPDMVRMHIEHFYGGQQDRPVSLAYMAIGPELF